MPCFKGLSVSIHARGDALPEYAIQRQTKHSRITSYIPVPPPKLPEDGSSDLPEQQSFAISITLLTPGMRVPYTKPRDAYPDGTPKPQFVGVLPETGNERGKHETIARPYQPITSSTNETVAAYIYFDGRSKEEVATLLRRGEETWVNSRWVSVPETEGGGLAEREFLFREVGLERWLNGLDLEGDDMAAKVKRRKARLQRRRRPKKEPQPGSQASRDIDMDMATDDGHNGAPDSRKDSQDGDSAPEDGDMAFSTDSDSEAPDTEATGQIKVALFRVIASGEIKRGEYSPQFDAHDNDDDDADRSASKKAGVKNGADPADVDHTTSFAKPKTLDPETISTQTVTGIDQPDKPYAVFTFLYRSDRQLQKMGILPGPKPDDQPAIGHTKRRSVQTDFTKLPPLRSGGAVGFSTFRDTNSNSSPSTKVKGSGAGLTGADSDEDVDERDVVSALDDDKNDDPVGVSSAADADQQGELAEQVRKMRLKRALPSDTMERTGLENGPAFVTAPGGGAGAAPPPAQMPSEASGTSSGVGAATPPHKTLASNIGSGSSLGGSGSAQLVQPPSLAGSKESSQVPEDAIGSPLKKPRPSLVGAEDDAMRKRLGLGLGLIGSGDGGVEVQAGDQPFFAATAPADESSPAVKPAAAPANPGSKDTEPTSMPALTANAGASPAETSMAQDLPLSDVPATTKAVTSAAPAVSDEQEQGQS